MDFPKEEVGKRIRILRKSRGFTADDLAKKIGVSQSMISQIERGLVSPSLDTLWKMSHCLKLPISAFFEEDNQQHVTVFRENERFELKKMRPNITYQPLSPSNGKEISLFKLILDPGETLDNPLMFHMGEECGYVLSGTIRVTVDGQSYELHQGDSIYFDSNLPHNFVNVSPTISTAIWAMTHPFETFLNPTRIHK
ncbi:helix-turn-helix domain-containing protein [Paenisporosarcina antarctica]|uniref:Cupin domain-containing protein n=1 Tax=Paenisporosarcina antarctica TaxID=417367 RepID=A0A4P6ZYK5_9BACL|nr:XRE family transcriptional regulator [Paenisporosarcina antarctica]QBP41780.1 cupin domain-containing protein [Paenisporosarcina antarctica]